MKRPDSHGWFFGFAATTLLCWILVVASNFFIDPLHYFRVESALNRRWLENERWAMPGVARHFPAEVVLIGTSRAQNENAATIGKAFGKPGLRLSIAGGTPYELAALTHLYLAHARPGVVLVELSTFPEHPSDTHRDAAFPEWLYEDSWQTDLRYVFSLEVFEFSLKILNGRGRDEAGGIGRWYETYAVDFGKLKRADVSCALLEAAFAPTADEQAMIEVKAQSAAVDFIPLLREHADTRFVFFFPPFNLSQYDSTEKLQQAYVQQRLAGLLGKYANATVEDFSLMPGVVTDDRLYRDPEHYSPEIGAKILRELAAHGKNRPAENPAALRKALYSYHHCPRT